MIHNFITNKYTKWYFAIVATAKNCDRSKNTDVYYEAHHILPKSLYSSQCKNKSNIVLLTAKEHFICHLLLTKMTEGRDKYKMLKAMIMMMSVKKIGKRKEYINARWYDFVKSQVKEVKKLYWTTERRLAHSKKLKDYNASVDKTSPAYVSRIEKIRQYQKSKIWTQKAIENRTHIATMSTERLQGTKWSEDRRKKQPNTQTSASNLKRHVKLKGRKTSSGMLNKSHSDETKKKMSETHKKIQKNITKGYWYLSPDNIEILFCPIKEISKLYNLCEERLRQLRLGKIQKNTYKNWKFLRNATIDEVQASNQRKQK